MPVAVITAAAAVASLFAAWECLRTVRGARGIGRRIPLSYLLLAAVTLFFGLSYLGVLVGLADSQEIGQMYLRPAIVVFCVGVALAARSAR